MELPLRLLAFLKLDELRLKQKMVGADGLEPPKPRRTSDLQSDAFATQPYAHFGTATYTYRACHPFCTLRIEADAIRLYPVGRLRHFVLIQLSMT